MLAGHEAVQAMAPAFMTWRSQGDATGALEAQLFLDAEDVRDIPVDEVHLKPGVCARVTLSLPPPQERQVGQRVRIREISRWTQEVIGDDGRSEGEEKEVPIGDPIFPTRNWFAGGYGPFRRLSAEIPEPSPIQDKMRDPSSPTEIAGRFSTLFQEDASLAESVSWIVSIYLRSLEKKPGARRLLDTVLEILSDGLLPDGYRVVKVDSDGLWVKRSGRSFPLKEMSDGYRTVTALVLDIVRNLHNFHGALKPRRSKGKIALHVPGVVLIDEIDAHLHVSWQQRIGDWLKEHFPKIQFIVTTHSPYICQSADPGGLIRLPGPDEQVGPAVVDEALYRRIVYGSGDDAALSALFGLDTPYSRQAEEARAQLIALEEKVFSGSASQAEVRRYQELSSVLTSSLEARVDEVSSRLGRKS